jgi:ankyrin repeat protein
MFLPSLLLLKPTTADAEADAEVVSIHGQRRQRARRRFFQAVLEDDDRGVLEGIEAGARLNQVDTAGETPLIVAAKRGYARIVRILLDAGANADARKAPLLTTALYWAVAQGWTDIALLLIERGANVSIMTAERDSPLLAATRFNHTDIAIALIQARARPNSVDRFGDTPLWNAIARGNRAVVRALLRAGADANLAHEDDGRTPLLAAVEAGQRRIVKLLLNAGASPNLADEDGTTPLMIVRDVKIAQALLARGAQRGARNKAGRTALDIARHEGRDEMVHVRAGRVGGEAGPSTDTGGS